MTGNRYKTNKEDILLAYNQSNNLTEAGKKVGMKKNTFVRHLRFYGGKVRVKKKTMQKRSKIDGSKVKLLYQSGISVIKMAKMFSVTSAKIYRVMELFDIPRKDLGQKGIKRKGLNWSGKNNHNWKGGVMFDGKRKLIYCPNHPNPDFAGRYNYNYRLIMEKHLGRFLNKQEVVHHINGDITDDRIENLQVCTQAEHCKMHFTKGEV